jgi:hypothetical protein
MMNLIGVWFGTLVNTVTVLTQDNRSRGRDMKPESLEYGSVSVNHYTAKFISLYHGLPECDIFSKENIAPSFRSLPP